MPNAHLVKVGNAFCEVAQVGEVEVVPCVDAQAAEWAHDAGLGVNAGHDLNLANLRDFAESVPHLDEVSIGHALISDALYLGLSNAVAQYRACLHTP